MKLSIRSVAAVITILTVSHWPAALAAQPQIVIDVAQPGHAISPMLYGLMTEEINHSYDGGIYAELIQNRSFKDDPKLPVHWSVVQDGGGIGQIALDLTDPLNTAQNVSCDLTITRATSAQPVGIANDGFWGIPVRPYTVYKASFYAEAKDGFAGPVTAALQNADGRVTYASASIENVKPVWSRYRLILKTQNSTPSAKCRFVIFSSHPGTLRLSLVSLFPPTYNNRPNGNRIDLMGKLAAMHPAFLRLPGGAYLEGSAIANRFNWKSALHDIAQRPGHLGTWRYRSSDGMGLLEFMEWCEDLHTQSVLAVYAGFSGSSDVVPPGPELAPYVQDALDEIEYVAGGKNTKWGAVRAADGHPAPFPLTYVEIGNEDFFDKSGSYAGRFAQYYDAIRAKYPHLKLIATDTHSWIRGNCTNNNPKSAELSGRIPDIIDDHYYRTAAGMEADVDHYDRFDRSGPKIFVGEWASTEGSPTPTMNAALGDAAWMTGLERNSDVVVLASYAPLLVNVNHGARQWGTNLIGYDALNSFVSPSYYAQVMFAKNRGDVVLPVTFSEPPTQQFKFRGAIGVGSWTTQAQFKEIQVTDGSRVLYSPDFTGPNSGGQVIGGSWSTNGGVLTQTSNENGCAMILGDPNWTDYTLNLKACKTGGKEGFLILVHARDKDNFVRWNIGGWADTKTQVQQISNGVVTNVGKPDPTTIQIGRWYDVQIVVKGSDIKCFLDGKLINEVAEVSSISIHPVFAEASRDRASGDVILKLVNSSGSPLSYEVNLRGAGSVKRQAMLTELSGNPTDVNTVSQPIKIAPKVISITDASKCFPITFPAYSISVLRLSLP